MVGNADDHDESSIRIAGAEDEALPKSRVALRTLNKSRTAVVGNADDHDESLIRIAVAEGEALPKSRVSLGAAICIALPEPESSASSRSRFGECVWAS